MKIKFILLSSITAIFLACGSTPTDPHAGHNHAPGEGHETEAKADDHAGHDHAPGEGHETDAKVDDHAGHDHAPGKGHETDAKADDHAGHDHSATSETGAEMSHEGEIVLPESQAKELGVTWQEVEPSTFTSIIHTSGRIEAAPGDDIVITSPVSGIVSLASGKIAQGTAVTRGSGLFTISSADLVDNNQTQRIADARAQLSAAEAAATRLEALYTEKLATADQIEQARLTLTQAQQNLKTLTINTGDRGRSISSPIGGYLTTLNVRQGDYVNQGQPLGTVSSNRSVVLRADLPSRHFGQVGAVQSANFTTPYDGKNYDITQLNGRLLSASRQATAENNYSLPIRFSIDNSGGFISGTVVDVFLKGAPRAEVITVPLTALTEEQGAHYVYIRNNEEGVFQKRNVRIGANDGQRVEILSGLMPHQTVVTAGAYFVRLASMSTAIPDGHNH